MEARPHAADLLVLLLYVLLAASPLLAQSPQTPTAEIAWSFDTGGPVWGTAAVRDGQVFFGSTDGRVYALDIAHGDLVWSHATGGPIYGGVSLCGADVCALSDDGYLYRLNAADGTERWRFDTHRDSVIERHAPAMAAPGGTRWDFRTSVPTEAEGIVYAGSSDGRLYAIDAATGAEQWHYATGDVVRSTPVVAGEAVLFGSFDGRVTALDKTTGALRWEHVTDKPINSTAAVHDGVAYVGSRDTNLYALRVDDGAVVWAKTYDGGSWVESSGTLYDDTLYIGSSDWDSALAIDPADGSTIWQTRIMDGGVYSRPAVTDDAYYTGVFGFAPQYQPDGALVRLDRTTGEVVWIHRFDDLPDRDGHGLAASPVLAEGLILVGALDGTFYAFRETGP